MPKTSPSKTKDDSVSPDNYPALHDVVRKHLEKTSSVKDKDTNNKVGDPRVKGVGNGITPAQVGFGSKVKANAKIE